MAQLGKAVKGRSKDKKKKAEKGTQQSSAQKALEEKTKRMEQNDAAQKLARATKSQLAEKLKVEHHNSNINRFRIQNQWRKIMRLAKVESLRKDIEILSQNHERDVDRKDAIIQMLDRDLEEAEEQFQMALRCHLQNVDQLIDIQDSRLLMLENEFEKDLNTLTQEFNTEREQVVRQHQLEKNELVDIMAAVQAEENDREAEAKQEHEQTREEIRNKNLEDINVLRITLESTIEELERHFESSHLNYLQNTDQRTQDFKFLTRKDQDLSKEIEAKIRRIEKLQASLAHWRTKINQNVKECEDRNGALADEKDQISAHFQKLKSRLNKFRDQQSKRLTDLARTARSAKERMNAKLSKAERILKLAELARKLETEQEKVLPFQVTSGAAGEVDVKSFGGNGNTGGYTDVTTATTTAEEPGKVIKSEEGGAASGGVGGGAEESGSATIPEWNKLDRFFRKFNKVHLDKVAIERERERLQHENTQLQSALKQYLDGITVNDDVLRDDNPLLVVNGRVRLNRPPMARQSDNNTTKTNAFTSVEANHMVNTNRVFQYATTSTTAAN